MADTGFPDADAQARRDPEALALVHGAERLTFGELAARVHRTARLLRAEGAGADDVVALALPRGVDLDGMLAEARRARGEKPVIATNARTGAGVEAVADAIARAVLFAP